MKHLITFNESAGDLAGKKPQGISNSLWADLKYLTNAGFATFTIEDIGIQSNAKLKAFDDMFGVFDYNKKLLILKTIDHEEPYRITLTEEEGEKNVIDKNGTTKKVNFLHYVIEDKEDRRLFGNLRGRISKWKAAQKKDKNFTDENGTVYPNEKIREIIKSNQYYQKILQLGYTDTSTNRQSKNGSIEFSKPYVWTKTLTPYYLISKIGKVYYSASSQNPTIYTRPPLKTISDYNRCLEFIYNYILKLDNKR